MLAVNPWIVPRNHRVEAALTAASEHGDLGQLDALLAAATRPFDELPARARFAEPAVPEVTACHRTFCGT